MGEPRLVTLRCWHLLTLVGITLLSLSGTFIMLLHTMRQVEHLNALTEELTRQRDETFQQLLEMRSRKDGQGWWDENEDHFGHNNDGDEDFFFGGRGACWAKCIANQSTPWLMLAGDSVWQDVFRLLSQDFAGAGITKIADAWDSADMDAAPSNQDPEDRCIPKWYDRDTIYRISEGGIDKDFRVSLRFVNSAELRLEHLDANWSTIRKCCLSPRDLAKTVEERGGSATDEVLYSCDGEDRIHRFEPQLDQPGFERERWPQPHALVFSHGLWNLPSKEWVLQKAEAEARHQMPKKQVDDATAFCWAYSAETRAMRGYRDYSSQPRHFHLARRLSKMAGRLPYFRWATNYRIKYHKDSTLDHIRWDIQCQKKAAEKFDIQLLDVWQYTEEGNETVHIQDDGVGIDAHVNEMLLQEVFRGMNCPCPGSERGTPAFRFDGDE